MRNCWAIAIGINQYQFFQPLNYAQRDAQAFRDFLVEEARLPPHQFVLLTDSAEAILTGAPVPNRNHILEQVSTVCEKLRPDDVLWVFFSGYGVRMQGRDYWVPLDGDPEKLSLTAIALDELFTLFEAVPKSHIILALDMNRSQGALQGQGVGEQTISLAERQSNCVLLLSCQPEQFSQETLALRHGFFTAALLEGLRYENCLTPDSLAIYLRDRLPELTEHHWRPVQDPVTILHPEEKYVLLLPQEVMQYAGGSPSYSASGAPAPAPQLPNLGAYRSGESVVSSGNPTATAPVSILSSSTSPESQSAPVLEATRSPQTVSFSERISSILADPFWRSLLTWGSLIVVALLIGVIIRNRTAFWGSSTSSAPASTDSPSVTITPISSGESQLQQAIAALGQPQTTDLAAQTAAFTKAIAIAQGIPASDPAYPEAQNYIQRWQFTTVDLAKSQAVQGDFQGAIASIQALLPTDNAELETTAQRLIVGWSLAAQNQAILAKASELARPDQASTLNEAIGTARTIPSGQPFYEEAQTSIDQWSQTILKLATARANAEDYTLAVQTAQLVPPGTVAYENAQIAITRWQEQALQERASDATE